MDIQRLELDLVRKCIFWNCNLYIKSVSRDDIYNVSDFWVKAFQVHEENYIRKTISERYQYRPILEASVSVSEKKKHDILPSASSSKDKVKLYQKKNNN